jgi:pilus assembly protein Flp/PilA
MIEVSGATAIEYALIAAGIALTIITAVNGVGSSVSGLFTSVSSSLR